MCFIRRRLLPPKHFGSRAAIAAALLVLAACWPSGSVPEAETRLTDHVVLISLDGFRWDYLDRAPAVRLRELAGRGVRAERMLTIFPSKTFPSHYTLVTGLWAEQHGIVANNMRDPELGAFTQRDTAAQSEPRWWGGEPIWVTAERQGLRAASAGWPGSEARIKGYAPTWWTRYWHDEPHESRVQKVLDWLALPADSAPALITVYFHDVDTQGHRFGPSAPETDSAIAKVDRSLGRLMDGIAALGKQDRVTLIVVADHGMAPTSIERVIALDDYVDLQTVDVIDWTPVAAIAPKPGFEDAAYRALKDRHPHLQVYRKGEVPARWHFNDHPRITEIVAVADEGWTITTDAQIARWRETGWSAGGTHGYDPELVSMGAVFVAAGPGIARGRVVPPFRNIHVYPLMARLLGLQPAETAGSLDSVRRVLR